jgi:DNA-directed RNA polymerase subunit RPC12/RpoP
LFWSLKEALKNEVLKCGRLAKGRSYAKHGCKKMRKMLFFSESLSIMNIHNPSPEELDEWARTAAKRHAILPESIQIKGLYITVLCGHCSTQFTRKLLPNRNDPVYVCPACNSRNYVPVEW